MYVSCPPGIQHYPAPLLHSLGCISQTPPGKRTNCNQSYQSLATEGSGLYLATFSDMNNTRSTLITSSPPNTPDTRNISSSTVSSSWSLNNVTILRLLYDFRFYLAEYWATYTHQTYHRKYFNHFFTLSYDWMVWYGNKQHNVVIFGVSKNRSTLILSLWHIFCLFFYLWI